jgi:hypothetical protein
MFRPPDDGAAQNHVALVDGDLLSDLFQGLDVSAN